MPDAEIIMLDVVRARSTPIKRSETAIPNPQEKIKTAADAWLVDSVIGAAEQMMGRLITTNKPLLPDERVRMMRASAALLGQPEA
jgi:hypothetical protein